MQHFTIADMRLSSFLFFVLTSHLKVTLAISLLVFIRINIAINIIECLFMIRIRELNFYHHTTSTGHNLRAEIVLGDRPIYSVFDPPRYRVLSGGGLTRRPITLDYNRPLTVEGPSLQSFDNKAFIIEKEGFGRIHPHDPSNVQHASVYFVDDLSRMAEIIYREYPELLDPAHPQAAYIAQIMEHRIVPETTFLGLVYDWFHTNFGGVLPSNELLVWVVPSITNLILNLYVEPIYRLILGFSLMNHFPEISDVLLSRRGVPLIYYYQVLLGLIIFYSIKYLICDYFNCFNFFKNQKRS